MLESTQSMSYPALCWDLRSNQPSKKRKINFYMKKKNRKPNQLFRDWLGDLLSLRFPKANLEQKRID